MAIFKPTYPTSDTPEVPPERLAEHSPDDVDTGTDETPRLKEAGAAVREKAADYLKDKGQDARDKAVAYAKSKASQAIRKTR